MTKATLATRAAVGLSAALISALSLVACGSEDSGADEPVEETSELVDDSADDSADDAVEDADEDADESAKRRDRERPATRDERRHEPSEQDEETASQSSESNVASGTMSAQEFCAAYTRYETNGVFAEADSPTGARQAADRLDRLASRAPRAIEEDIQLMARLYGEIADANGDEDELAEIDASDLPATQKHLERWQKKHC